MSVERVDLTEVLGPSPGYAYAATASGGKHVYTAGAVAVEANGSLIGRGDLEAQTRSVIANLQQVRITKSMARLRRGPAMSSGPPNGHRDNGRFRCRTRGKLVCMRPKEEVGGSP
jgi:hypothetical protein